MADFYYDDTRLQRLFEELSPKERQKALKGAFRRAASSLRKVAVANLRSSGLQSNRDVEKGIRAVVWKKSLGFRITIGTKRTRYKGEANDSAAKRRRKLAVVPLWAEGGTEDRYSKRTKRTKLGRWVDPKGKYRGRLSAYGFMTKTKGETDGVEEELKTAIIAQIERAARKNGATVT